MNYEIEFTVSALKEWKKLDSSVREQFRAKLKERRSNPRVPSARLSGAKSRYKIKLRKAGYRLAYEVHDDVVVILVIAVGRRDRIYDDVANR